MSLAHNPRFKALGSVVATAAIPAVVLGSLATPAQAAPITPARDALTPKLATPSMVKAAEARIAAHLVASQVPTSLTPVTAKKTGTETVRKNDTLSHITVRTGVSVADLKRINGLSSDQIFPGQVLKLSGSSAASPKSNAATKAPAKQVRAQSYKIKSGDTISGIAAKLGVSVSDVRRAAGNPTNDFIYAGHTLNIGAASASNTTSKSATSPTAAPGTSASGMHTVRAGENPSVIASRYGMKLATFMSLNNLGSGSIIKPGQVLKTSGKASAAPSAKAPAGSAKAPVNKTPAARQSTYTIVPGDTLIGIGIKTGTPVNTLLKLNTNFSYTTTLIPGATLKISGSASTGSSTTSGSSVKPSSSKPLVGNTFLGRKYSSGTVNSANANKQALLSVKQPSRAQMQSMVSRTAQQMGVDPSLALAHAFQESSFDMNSVSPANAVGVMQVIPSAGAWAENLIGRKLNLLDPQDNVTAGVAIIRHHQRNSPSKEIGIASYYQGAAGVKKYGMYADTKRYVANITALQNRF